MLNFNISEIPFFNIYNSLKSRAMVGIGSYLVRTNIGQPLQLAVVQASTRYTRAEETLNKVLNFNILPRMNFNNNH